MIKNYLKIAWRNIRRNKVNSVINIAGLAIGLACMTFIVMYVQDELRFDRGFRDVGNIYQVNLDGIFGGQPFNRAFTPPPVGLALHTEFPEVTDYTRICRLNHEIIKTVDGQGDPGSGQPVPAFVRSGPASRQSGNSFTEKGLWAVDSNFLQVFNFPMAEGNPSTCLMQFHSIVLTETTAKKYFGKTPAIGKTLVFDDYKDPFVVTGVLKDLPEASSLQFGMLMPVRDYPLVKRFTWSWVFCVMSTYVVLNDKVAASPAAVQRLEAKFPDMVKRLAVKAFSRIGQPYEEFLRKGGKWNFYLQPFTSVHLHSADIGNPLTNMGDIKYVYIFSCIGLFIIVLACVNFMNLSTAQALRRAKEVGVRKVLGSLRGQLIRQFLTEALLYSGLATLLALLMVSLLMEPFNSVAGKSLQFSDLFRHGAWLLMLLLTFITGLLAGSYPAFYLTAFRPVDVLKGGSLSWKSSGNRVIRNGLVVFQFTVSIALIICTILVFQQLQYTRNKDLGLKKDNVMILPNMEKLKDRGDAFRQEVAKISGVERVSISTGVPADDFSDFTDFYVPETSGVMEPLAKDIPLTSYIVDEDFIPALHIQMIKGRNFSKDFSDSASVIVNERTARQIGWMDPLGKLLRYPGGGQTFKVVGVVKDFNLSSLRDTIMPFALFYVASKSNNNGVSFAVASLGSGNPEQVVRKIESEWKDFAPGIPFEYSFLDKDFEALYLSENRMGAVFRIFTFLSIAVACLGLFGLSVYTTERRIKEIGIRKILGASVTSVVSLLSRDIVVLVILSALIAFPIAWWASNKWLEDFAYRIPISAWVFFVSGILAIAIALVTVSFQAIKAALASPAKHLRSE
jgi:putative ABC transport system permease protein